jgi:polysaccharide deacetylase family protein (PEP-CTERM system associated)
MKKRTCRTMVETRTGPSAVTHALTVDVEDYFHVEAFRSRIPAEAWDTYPLRVASSTARILDLLDAHGVRATFFVLGWVARKVPRLIADIVSRGHELGCHSDSHRLVYTLRRDEFRADVREAMRAIEDAAGVRPRGYRAPSFSITRRSLWALPVLAEEGFAYDSSIFPIRHDIYGFPEFPRFPVRVGWGRQEGRPGGSVPQVGSSSDDPSVRRASSIVEFPASTVRVLGRNFPGPGGGYLRILPLRYSLWALRRIAEREVKPASVYLHPWEVDPDQPRIRAGLRSRFRHYTGLERTAPRLASIFDRFRFAPMGEVIAELNPLETVPLESFGFAARD